ncbi:MAG: hypothetical protein CBC05_00780 [Crocinitomicaceae bacterium TMED45]|nr:MAG: hypothetical protein CBC05_00780 [Crocinitomicaceae bacterium TMED45]|tara:strand:+ start:2259 stop:2915 length:657 start_codon:yes stop_codon:yes gene_type:complete
MKQFFVLIAACMLAITPSFAQDAGDDFADYGVGLAISPFGPSLNLTYNVDAKNSISAGFGFSPEVDAPSALLPEITDLTSVTGSSSWMGIFWRHRPLENPNFGINLGMAAGQIDQNLFFLPIEGEPVTFDVNYTENPVMYLGLSYGLKPVKGLQFGVDLGVLSTGGAEITYTGHDHGDEDEEHAEEIEDRLDGYADEIKDKFAWTMLPNIQIGVSYGF